MKMRSPRAFAARVGVRVRVVAAFALAAAVLLLAAGIAVREGLEDQLTDAVDDGLQTRVAIAGRLLRDAGGPRAGLTAGIDDPGESFTQILDPEGRVVLATPGVPRTPLLDAPGRRSAVEGLTVRLRGIELDDAEDVEEVDLEALEETAPEAFEEDLARLLARSTTVKGRRYAIIAGTTFEDTDDALHALTRVLLIAGPLVLLGACLVGYGAVAGALRPVESMRRRAALIGGDASDERLPVTAARDEVGRLGTTLNAMLDRLQAALRHERAFVADAGHELRTPLAIQQTELELALRGERSPEELRAALASALEETVKLTGLTEHLLLLARGDDGALDVRPQPLDAVGLLYGVGARVGAAASAAGRTLAVHAPEGLVVHGDRDRLEQALVALVDNALKHGAGPVELGAQATGADVELWVADRGPGLPAGFAERAFERFSRPDSSRSSAGSGLGLAIVRAIAEAHGGTAELRSREGGGLQAVVIVPSSAAA
ncbi:hypothetical protein DSM112329_02765 [Paraconexibacter sp. AEG42_29]|uniref:histidine kinase n=1 Tax=Paraconexibacter sp. AEG42_29 TaxID=2997339 RepID=A0AAU7AWQ8_9ACTN